jgi:two-component system nitrogen regulation response regulator NtrX
MTIKTKVIIVDDEPNIRRSIKTCLTIEGYSVEGFAEPDGALKSMLNTLYDIAIIDIRLKERSGITLFERMKEEKIDIPVIFISGNASLDEAAQTHKIGAYDFIEKPFNAEKLIVTLRNCIEFNQLRTKVKSLESSQNIGTILGEHEIIKMLRRDISKVALSDAAVLISGESGTGKELIAESIHAQSTRSKKPMVKVNCSAIPESLIESALFGHVKGAFTGADQHKKGYFEIAEDGTLFLDEIADMPLSAQSSLLRVLESKEIQKVGSDEITKVNVRLLTASHKSLKKMVDSGEFRQDLYYRINVIPLTSPSLRERKSDIPLLVSHFFNVISKRLGLVKKQIDPKCYTVLSEYHWYGNVRELVNTVERMLIMGPDIITLADLPNEVFIKENSEDTVSEKQTLKEYRHQMERKFIVEKLKLHNGNISKVAQILAIDRTSLHKKINQYNIQRDLEGF